MDQVGSYRCDCVAGYTGSNCETSELNLLIYLAVITCNYMYVSAFSFGPLVINKIKQVITISEINLPF